MRVGMVTPTYQPYRGGVGEHVRHVAHELGKLGHDVTVVTTRFGGRCDVDDVEVVRLGRAVLVPANGSLCPVAVGPAMRRRVRGVFRRRRFDVVHVHEPFLPMLSLAAVAEAPCPVVATFHASNESPLGYRVFRRRLEPYAQRLSERIAVSRAALATVEPFFGGSYEIVPNGVEVARFAEAEPFDRDPREFRILFVGRLEQRKGLEHLLAAMPRILEDVPEARLIVVGGGPLSGYYRSRVPARARSRVEFTGFAPHADVPRHYRSADVYCSPATGGESFGIVLLEAMAAGAAVVASDIPGYRDVVHHGATGLLVSRESPESIAAGIVQVARFTELADRLRANARREVEQYDWSRVSRRILGVYERAAGAGKPSDLAGALNPAVS
ncbi:MAG: glycosyltransferase [Candidatus Eisenbacteria bacterium]|nr:glycosyltransferase [Candidatus Eisenbacteria bacterium]